MVFLLNFAGSLVLLDPEMWITELRCVIGKIKVKLFLWLINHQTINTGYTQKNGAVSKVNKKFISHLTRAQRTPSAVATVQVSHALITVVQCVRPGSHDTHQHGNQIHPRPGVTCPL